MKSTYAENPEHSQGRDVPEQTSLFRSEFQRDRDRIIHSGAFRRLQHKTQVFLEHEGDFFRTRLTHTIEVAQVARSISNILGLEIDLTEAIALAHDLGHPPFGHTGEYALNACMEKFGGFDHNSQSLKVVTVLENNYAGFSGLNLTWETLEGIAKHNGPLKKKPENDIGFVYAKLHKRGFGPNSSAEAQVAAIADDIAYNTHDIADGLRAKLFSMDDLKHIPSMKKSICEIDQNYTGLPDSKRRHEILRKVFNTMVMDVITESQMRLKQFEGLSVLDVRNNKQSVISFSPEFEIEVNAIRDVLFKKMYQHQNLSTMRNKCTDAVKELFERFVLEPSYLPEEWLEQIQDSRPESIAWTISDYLAGMTDRYALQQYERLFNKSLEL